MSVYSRNYGHASELAFHCHSTPAKKMDELNDKADLVLIAVNDSHIESISGQLSEGKTVVHTSGITPLSVLANGHPKAGIFYPLQTISKGHFPEAKQVPVLLESTDNETQVLLETMANQCGLSFLQITSEKRRYIHLSAVFVNNFGNHLAQIAQQILADQELPFELLKPLILQTALKLQMLSPADNQTGPAKRGDVSTIEEHLALLGEYPEFKKLYKLFTESIGKC